jgi:hypothetical protein
MKAKDILNIPEIRKRVYEKVPISKDERKGCVTEKAFRDKMREEMAKKLYDEMPKEKQEYGK